MYSFVVPTRNRPAYLERLLRYYVGQELAAPMIVADSSTTPEVVAACRDLCTRARAEGLVIDHQVHDPRGSFHGKLVDALGTVTTPYAGFVADDDFIVPAGARACAEHLHAHPGCALAQGRALAFTLGMEARKEPVLTTAYPVRAIRGATGARRLAAHLSWYSATFYAMQATAALRQNMRLAAERCDEYQFGELLPSCLQVVQGEVALLDVLYAVRESGRQAAGRLQAPWHAHRRRPEFAARYARFRDAVVDELGRVDDLVAPVAGVLVDQLFLRVFLTRERARPFALRWKRQLADAVRHAPRALAEAVTGGLPRMLADPRAAYWRLVYEHAADRPDPYRIDTLLDASSRDHTAFAPIHALLVDDLDIADHPMRSRRT